MNFGYFQIGTELLLFSGYHILEPIAKSLAETLETMGGVG